MINDLRQDEPAKLPFIACTIGELKETNVNDRMAINALLMDLPIDFHTPPV